MTTEQLTLTGYRLTQITVRIGLLTAGWWPVLLIVRSWWQWQWIAGIGFGIGWTVLLYSTVMLARAGIVVGAALDERARRER